MNLQCIKCDATIEQFLFNPNKGPVKITEENADSLNFDGGVVGTINAGYGSHHDTRNFVIAICDHCLDACEQVS